jgi:hypothetical protein
VDAVRAQPVVGEQALGVLAAGARKPLAAERERGERRLHQQAHLVPLVDVVALHDAVPATDLLLEEPADPGGGVDVQVAADLAAHVADPVAEQQLGRPDRAAG